MPDLKPGDNLIRRLLGRLRSFRPSLRANGSRECVPADTLREAIHGCEQEWLRTRYGLLRRLRSSQWRWCRDRGN